MNSLQLTLAPYTHVTVDMTSLHPNWTDVHFAN